MELERLSPSSKRDVPQDSFEGLSAPKNINEIFGIAPKSEDLFRITDLKNGFARLSKEEQAVIIPELSALSRLGKNLNFIDTIKHTALENLFVNGLTHG